MNKALYYQKVRDTLDKYWDRAIQSNNTAPDEQIDQLTNSKTASIRYAVITQLFGKVIQPQVHILKMQTADGGEGTWNARSFADNTIVPWSQDTQNIVSNSSTPYLSKPLRRKVIKRNMSDVKDKSGWNALVDFLEPLNTASEVELEKALMRVMESFARRLNQQNFNYPIPQRVSLPELLKILENFLGQSSGGLRPMATATALFKVIGKAFTLFDDVKSQGLTEADVATGAAGDITCYYNGEIRLVVEVKAENLTLAHVRSSTLKARGVDKGLSNLLFTTPDTNKRDRQKIEEITDSNFTSGLNIYISSITYLTSQLFILLKEDSRIEFIRSIGEELDCRSDLPARRAWYDLLKKQIG